MFVLSSCYLDAGGRPSWPGTPMIQVETDDTASALLLLLLATDEFVSQDAVLRLAYMWCHAAAVSFVKARRRRAAVWCARRRHIWQLWTGQRSRFIITAAVDNAAPNRYSERWRTAVKCERRKWCLRHLAYSVILHLKQTVKKTNGQTPGIEFGVF